jgi:uncharacterized protein (DUF362 family)
MELLTTTAIVYARFMNGCLTKRRRMDTLMPHKGRDDGRKEGCTMDEKAIYVAYGRDPLALGRALIEASGAADFFKAGRSVSVKPNLVVAKPASSGATTHAGFAEAVFQIAREAGVRDLSIIEGSWLGADTGRAFAAEGYDRLAKKYDAKLIDLKKDQTVKKQVGGGTAIVCRSALETDILVNLPVLKAHCQTRMTCAVKNLKGCIPDSEKRRYHAEGLMRPISLLPGLIPTAFTLVDGICGDLTFEEGGTPIPMDLAFLGRDPLCVDAYAAQLIGIDVADVPYLTMAERLGLGSLSPSEIHTVGETDTQRADLRASDGFGRVKRLTRGVREAGACSACYGSLVRALYTLDEEGTPARRNVCIGQGFKGQSGDALGVGRCCAGFTDNVPGCPPDARSIVSALRRN